MGRNQRDISSLVLSLLFSKDKSAWKILKWLNRKQHVETINHPSVWIYEYFIRIPCQTSVEIQERIKTEEERLQWSK